MEDYSFVVGQEFSDVKALRNAVKEAAIARHFELKIVKSDLVRYVAKCAGEGCPWRIRAVKLPNVTNFSVRSLKEEHTCEQKAQTGHQQASVDWIVSFIEEKLRDNINYKPKDILEDIHKQFGVIIPYKQAWRARERGLTVIYGSSEEGYRLLPSYCEQIKTSNPGSAAEVLTTGSDNRFQQLFVCFFASTYGFMNGCVPIISLGQVQLRSKYLGTFLSATCFDSDGGLFPLAFAVVDEENDDTWFWFLSELGKALAMHTTYMPRFTFLSDCQNGAVRAAIKREFPGSCNNYCVQLLSEAISKEFKNPRLAGILWKAAYSSSVIGFRERMAEIAEISEEAGKWILNFPPSCWGLAYTEGTRCGHVCSNADSFNKWVLEAQELPIIQIMERIHQKLMTDFEERRSRSNAWDSILTPSAENRLAEAMNRSSAYQVIPSDEVEFEVVSKDRSEIVNIGTRTCSCREWQHNGIPCSHAASALLFSHKNVHDYVEKCFTSISYGETYAGAIYPIPSKIHWRRATEYIRPPNVRRLPGRPEKKRICIDHDHLNKEKHAVRCSRCNQAGHYKTTCKADIFNGIQQC